MFVIVTAVIVLMLMLRLLVVVVVVKVVVSLRFFAFAVAGVASALASENGHASNYRFPLSLSKRPTLVLVSHFCVGIIFVGIPDNICRGSHSFDSTPALVLSLLHGVGLCTPKE